MRPFQLGTLCVLLFAGGVGLSALTAAVSPETIEEAEETYELRLERVLLTKGHRALVEHLARELKERPRPYVKAWYANYLLYGAEFGLPQLADPPRGFLLAKESAEEGSLFGAELVGRAWGDGRGCEARTPELAVKFLRQAAERGRHTAMAELGKFYFFGAGVPKDQQAGEAWIRKAAWLGATGPMITLAEWWENPAYVGVANRAKANALYYKVGELGSNAALNRLRERAKNGDADALKYVHLDLLVIALRGYDALPSRLRAAVKWLEENTAATDVPVQLALANAMKERELVVYNPAEAREKAARAAAAGSDDARALLAEMAWRGIGQRADKPAAVAAWRELAEKGNAIALNQLGWLHWWGNGEEFGVPKDAAKAFEFCRRSAELGHWSGQLNLAECYAHGIGVSKNYHMAAKYYGILEDRRYKHARRMKERILGYVQD